MPRRKPGFGRVFPDHLITVVDVDDVSSTMTCRSMRTWARKAEKAA